MKYTWDCSKCFGQCKGVVGVVVVCKHTNLRTRVFQGKLLPVLCYMNCKELLRLIYTFLCACLALQQDTVLCILFAILVLRRDNHELCINPGIYRKQGDVVKVLNLSHVETFSFNFEADCSGVVFSM